VFADFDRAGVTHLRHGTKDARARSSRENTDDARPGTPHAHARRDTMTLTTYLASSRTSRVRDDVERLALSGDELRAILLRSGGLLVARQVHGDLLAVRKHLVFVRRNAFLPAADVRDALRISGLTHTRVLQILVELRHLRHAPR
jgi:hypothetical protein